MGKPINEGILDSLIKMLFTPKIERELKKAERKVKKDPKLQRELEHLRKVYQRARISVKNHCDAFPDSPICDE